MSTAGAINGFELAGAALNGDLLVAEISPPAEFGYFLFQGSLNGESINAIDMNKGSPVNSGVAAPRGRLVSLPHEPREIRVTKDIVR